MTLTEIENLSFADLKARRDELLASLKDADRAELTARYLQARTDAKQRDEKLAEQGQTITALQAGVEALTREKAKLESDLSASHELVLKREGECRAVEVELDKCKSEAVTAIQKLTADLAQETARANAGEALAKARRKALADVTGICNPLLAAE